MKNFTLRLLPVVVSLYLLLIPAEAGAQIVKRERPEGERPKIGLVLSGGGAKGLAHIGVLKAIDRSGLKIDYIAGTSMGAIVAAMYAAGYSGEQIEEMSKKTEWMKLINSRPVLQDISIEEKDEFDNYTITLPMKGFVPQISTGFFTPYQVMTYLQEIFFPVYKTTDFSKLDIPFLCVAADIATGDAVVLDHGDLAFATRSSMAIPGVFSATEYGETKLVDGGIIRNFPVRDVVGMGADFVIGVNLFSGLTPADQMSTMLDVMLQITNFRDAKDLQEEKAACDMIIEPDVSRYNAASFAAADTIRAIGDSAGVEFEPLFRQLADSLHNAFDVPYVNPERMKTYDSQVRIMAFEFEGLDKTTRKLLLHALNLHAGHLYRPSDLTAAIKSAMSTGYYNNLTYKLIPLDDDDNSVTFHCKVVENPMTTLKVALSYNTFSNASIILDYQRRSLLGRLTTTDFKVAISKDFRFRVRNRSLFGVRDNHYLDIMYDNAKFEVPAYDVLGSSANLYDYIHNEVSATIGHTLSPNKDIAIKAGWEDFHVTPLVGTPDDRISGHIHNFFLNGRLRYNSLDRKFLPQNGTKFDLNLYLGHFPQYSLRSGAAVDSLKREGIDDYKLYSRVAARLESHQSITDRFAIGEVAAASVGFANNAFVQKTALGGPAPFLPSHFDFYGLITARRYESTMAMLRMSLQYNVFADVHLLFHLNSAVTFKSLEHYFDEGEVFKPVDYIHGGGVSVAYNLFGAFPMDFTLMYSPDDKFNVSVNLGYYF